MFLVPVIATATAASKVMMAAKAIGTAGTVLMTIRRFRRGR